MTTEDRFWAKVVKTDGCWLWTGCVTEHGYGRFGLAGRVEKAPRVAWFLTNGVIPAKLQVCHRCDVPACVNPAHLFLGSAAENAADARMKGRTAKGGRNGTYTHPETRPYGERSPHAKLTAAAVIEIRRLRAEGIGPMELARRFGVGHPTISKIVARQRWAHLPDACHGAGRRR